MRHMLGRYLRFMLISNEDDAPRAVMRDDHQRRTARAARAPMPRARTTRDRKRHPARRLARRVDVGYIRSIDPPRGVGSSFVDVAALGAKPAFMVDVRGGRGRKERVDAVAAGDRLVDLRLPHWRRRSGCAAALDDGGARVPAVEQVAGEVDRGRAPGHPPDLHPCAPQVGRADSDDRVALSLSRGHGPRDAVAARGRWR